MDPQNPTAATTSRSILAFPNEILADIFSDTCLSNKDLTNAQLTCKCFKEIIQPIVSSHRHYVFRVDAVSHPTWKLIRHLLAHPELNSGHQIRSITVEWERRIASDESTWTKDWVWTPEEAKKLQALGLEYRLTEEARFNVRAGKNSESLLSLLLCFTPNLICLDLGDIKREIVDVEGPGYVPGNHVYESSHIQAFHALGRYSRNLHNQDYSGYAGKYESSLGPLFFLENIYNMLWPQPSRNLMNIHASRVFDEAPHCLPGLRNLKYLSMHKKGYRRIEEMTLLHTLMLPGIERITTSNISVGEYVAHYTPNYDIDIKKPSTVKHLELDTAGIGSLSQGYLLSVAKITGNLSSVKIQGKASSEKRKDTSGEDEQIAKAFLRFNNNTLRMSEIYINGGGFGDGGQWVKDQERRVTVAKNQRLYEQNWPHGKSIAPPPRLLALEPLLASHILSLLPLPDILNLVLSCKALKKVCYPVLWSTFSFPNQDNFVGCIYSLNVNFGLLNREVEKHGIADIKYLESLTVADSIFASSGWTTTSAEDTKIFMMVCEQIRMGNTPNLKLVRLVLASDDYIFKHRNWGHHFGPQPPFLVQDCDGALNARKELLGLIKEYSEPLPPMKFSLELTVCICEGLDTLLRLCDLTKLTKLVIITTANNLDFNGKGSSDLDMLIKVLSLVASSCQQLKTLDISGFEYTGFQPVFVTTTPSFLGYNRNDARHFRPEIPPRDYSPFQDQLGVLQSLIFRLTSLKKLRVDGHIIDPSFIPFPPPGVERVYYEFDELKPAWWRKFSEHPFTGTEYLVLKFRGSKQPKKSPAIGKVQISSLKYFNVDMVDENPAAYPRDLLNLIIKNNERLSPSCLWSIAHKRIRMCESALAKKIEKIKELCGKELEGILTNAVECYAREVFVGKVARRGVAEDRVDQLVAGMTSRFLIDVFEEKLASGFVEKCTKAVKDVLDKGESSDK
ncbi:hypothetical protein TWF718_002250 [Orbilia javanica]|uniref:F-box domain-containing protein n=1 Tax=Orbilia javanica TaxID=47235 RepID=A0AAN8MHG0_9PEZI